eukprot:3781652-Amphidinium_carterae.1
MPSCTGVKAHQTQQAVAEGRVTMEDFPRLNQEVLLLLTLETSGVLTSQETFKQRVDSTAEVEPQRFQPAMKINR